MYITNESASYISSRSYSDRENPRGTKLNCNEIGQVMASSQPHSKHTKENEQMSFAGLYISPEGIVIGTDSLVETYEHKNEDLEKSYYILDKSAAIAITGQMTYGATHTSFSDIIKEISASTLRGYAVELYDKLKEYKCEAVTVIWIVGCEDGISIKYDITGNPTDSSWDLQAKFVFKGTSETYFSGPAWAREYAMSCSVKTNSIETIKESLRSIVEAICEADNKPMLRRNVIGGKVDIVTVLP